MTPLVLEVAKPTYLNHQASLKEGLVGIPLLTTHLQSVDNYYLTLTHDHCTFMNQDPES